MCGFQWSKIKILKTSSRTHFSHHRRIIDEESNIAKVNLKYIVSILGLCSEATAVVMEYMSNGSLNKLLASHTLMWPKKFQMIHEVSMGMDFLHSMKPPLLHLNLKTSNILLDDHLHVKVGETQHNETVDPCSDLLTFLSSAEQCLLRLHSPGTLLFSKISDFGLIHWEECTNKKLFMETLTARGNISYIPPETFSQCPDPPGTTFDVYRWLAKDIFEIAQWDSLLFFSDSVHNAQFTQCNLALYCTYFPRSLYVWLSWLSLSYLFTLAVSYVKKKKIT